MARKPKKTLADYPHLVAQLHPTKNGDIDPSKISYGSHLMLWWKCPKGTWPDGTPADDHEWQATVKSRTGMASGCPCCSGRKAVPSNCLPTTHPEIAAQWHPTKNGDLTPWDVTAGSHKKAWWKCCDGKWPDGTPANDHEWEATVCNRTSGNGCPCCYGRKAVPSNCFATTHPEIAAQWHSEKNGDLTPWDVTAGSHKKVHWKCQEGTRPDGTPADDHEWEAAVGDRTNGDGCPCCRGLKAVPSNCFATTHPEIAAQWHSEKNGDLTPWDVTAGCNKKVWWTCQEGTRPDGTPADDHEWEATICDRADGNGCPCCSGHKAVPSNSLATTHPEIAAQWHSEKNGDLTPWDVTAGCNRKVWWESQTCRHSWAAAVCDRTGKWKTGCPKCNKSKGEAAICKFLDTQRLKYKDEWHIPEDGLRKYKFDFMVDRWGSPCLIEYHGDPHYVPTSFRSKQDDGEKDLCFRDYARRDGIKEKWATDQKIQLLVISYWDFDRIPEMLDDFFFVGRMPTISEPPAIVKKHEPMRQKILDQEPTVTTETEAA